jgi:hypothetical protein
MGRCLVSGCAITPQDDPAHHWIFNHDPKLINNPSNPYPSPPSSFIEPNLPPIIGDNVPNGMTSPVVTPPLPPTPVAPIGVDDGLIHYMGRKYCSYAPCPKMNRRHDEHEEHKNSRLHFCEHGALCSRLHDPQHK